MWVDYHRIPEDEDVEAYKQLYSEGAACRAGRRRSNSRNRSSCTREAEEDTLAITKAHLRADAPVHVHCFTSSANGASGAAGGVARDCVWALRAW